MYNELERRVGTSLARAAMTNEQLDDFETYVDATDDAAAFGWLQLHFPRYSQVVYEEFGGV